MHHQPSMFAYPKEDAVAGVVVFLVALPLCLGIAVACGVPPVSGLIAGIVGGIVVSFVSRSPLSVTGPAAGLTSIVLAEVQHLGGIPPFLAAVILAGVLQAGFGLLKAGRFAALVPSAVIKGMLAAIGITIIWKQLPVAFGVTGGLTDIPAGFHLGAAAIAAVSLAVLYGWKHTPLAKFKLISPALVVVGEEVDDGARHRLGIAGRYHQTCVRDGLRDAADLGSHDGDPARHRLEDRVREPLGDAAEDRQLTSEEGGDGMADPAFERDHAAQIERVA